MRFPDRRNWEGGKNRILTRNPSRGWRDSHTYRKATTQNQYIHQSTQPSPWFTNVKTTYMSSAGDDMRLWTMCIIHIPSAIDLMYLFDNQSASLTRLGYDGRSRYENGYRVWKSDVGLTGCPNGSIRHHGLILKNDPDHPISPLSKYIIQHSVRSDKLDGLCTYLRSGLARRPLHSKRSAWNQFRF